MENLFKKVADGQPVYLDFPFDDCAVRVQPEGSGRKCFLLPYGGIEKEVDPAKNNRFWNALMGGDEITEEEYAAKATEAAETEEPGETVEAPEEEAPAPEVAPEPVMKKPLA